jgi:hypothetical protein
VSLLVLLCAPAWALDVSDGLLRLTLYDRTGRFSLSYLAKARSGISVSLLSAQDPRTSTLSVVVGNKIYRMGETSDFSQTVEKSARGGRFVWKSSFLQLTETFTFISSSDSSVTTGVQIDIGLKNISEKSFDAGIRCLFDTYLGEASFVHFRTDTLSQVSRELTLLPRDKTQYWVSPLSGDPEDIGFQVMTSGTGVTVPDKVVFANWKRLSDASWSYETSADRNFSQLPYSVNDSAVSQYYDPRAIPPGTEVTITLLMGKFAREGFHAAGPGSAQSFAASVEQSLAAATSSGDDAAAIRADLSTVNRVLVEINAALSAAGAVPDDKLGLMESALTELGGRSARYTAPDGR